MASWKEVDQWITRMLLPMGGEQIGDAVTESEGEEDAEQSAAEPTLQQQLQRALVTAAKSRVAGAPGQVGRPNFQRLRQLKRNYKTWAGAAHHHAHRRHEKRILLRRCSQL